MAPKLLLWTMLAASISASLAAPPKAPTNFNLKTIVVDGETSMGNLYLTSYHTGAGTADAVLVPEKPKNAIIYLNGTQIEFAYSNDFQTWLFMYPDVIYASWNPVGIDSTSGPSYGAFYFNNSASNVDNLGIGLKWNPNYPNPPATKNNLFGGWYACQWYHEVPQLFWIVHYGGKKPQRISTCSKVELVRESAT